MVRLAQGWRHGWLSRAVWLFSSQLMSREADNIFAGTQVVSLVEICGTNHSLVHPRGVVGVETRTPTGEQKDFLVRPDYEKANAFLVRARRERAT